MWGALITGIIGLIGSITTTQMGISAAEEQADKRQKAAQRDAASQRFYSSQMKYEPLEYSAPPAASIAQLGGGSRASIDTSPFQSSAGSSFRLTAADRIRQRLKPRS